MGLTYDDKSDDGGHCGVPNYGRNAALGAQLGPSTLGQAPMPGPDKRPTIGDIFHMNGELLATLSKLEDVTQSVHNRIGADHPPEATSSTPSDVAGPIDAIANQINEASRRVYNIAALVDSIGARI